MTRKFYFLFIGLIITTATGLAQEIDHDLLLIRKRMDSVAAFTAFVTLDLDVEFIKMPQKSAALLYKKGQPIQVTTDDFMMIPKRGLDFSLQDLFNYPFLTLERGTKRIDGKNLKSISVIPNDSSSPFIMATLAMDITLHRLIKAEINSKKEGTYTLQLFYADSKAILPEKVIISFEVKQFKLPLNFLARNAEVDRDKLKESETKMGSIILGLRDFDVELIK